MGTTSIHGREHGELYDRRMNPSIVQPGERGAIFSEALGRFDNRTRLLLGDLPRYWYAKSASLIRVPGNRAEQAPRALVHSEFDASVEAPVNEHRDRGQLFAAQLAPRSFGEEPDRLDGVHSVVLGITDLQDRRDGSDADTDGTGAEEEREEGECPARFARVVTVSSDRPARVMHHTVEEIVERLTVLTDSDVSLMPETHAKVRSGLECAKIRTPDETATNVVFV